MFDGHWFFYLCGLNFDLCKKDGDMSLLTVILCEKVDFKCLPGINKSAEGGYFERIRSMTFAAA